MQAMEISRTALDVEWRRLEVIAANLANANSAGVQGAGGYQPVHLVSGPKRAFEHRLSGEQSGPAGVEVYALEPVNAPPRRVHEPGNPQADADGYVSYPGLDHAAEMTLMVKTARAYEANVVAMNTARQMYLKAMEIGRK